MKNTIVICENNHTLHPDINELEEVLEMCSCPICDGELESITPPNIEVGCPLCSWSASENLNAAIFWLQEGCPNCQKIEEKFSKVYLVGSAEYDLSNIRAYRPSTENDISGLTRDGRPDYWEILIHFCKIEELISILSKKTILASPTGYFKKPAVCLTETPLEFASDIRKVHGGFGIAFKKGDIIRNGGMPAIYIIDSLMKAQNASGGFCDKIKPYINILRVRERTLNKSIKKKYDFLHEREWRIDKNIEFDSVKPIGIVLPETINTLTVDYGFIKNLHKYVHEYGEIPINRRK